eukprot:scaffold10546_cov133-Cylindrotheca_fusiformis.AAC.3
MMLSCSIVNAIKRQNPPARFWMKDSESNNGRMQETKWHEKKIPKHFERVLQTFVRRWMRERRWIRKPTESIPELGLLKNQETSKMQPSTPAPGTWLHHYIYYYQNKRFYKYSVIDANSSTNSRTSTTSRRTSTAQ